jgi:hypothetical protein
MIETEANLIPLAHINLIPLAHINLIPLAHINLIPLAHIDLIPLAHICVITHFPSLVQAIKGEIIETQPLTCERVKK